MKLSKKLALELSNRINALGTYRNMVDTYSYCRETDNVVKAMNWYNEEADALIAMGIDVNKYEIT